MIVLIRKRAVRAKLVFFLMFVLATAVIAGSLHSSEGWFDGRPFPAVNALPEQDDLPDPFLGPGGKRVQTLTQWQQQREYLKAMLAHYMYGHMPPAPKPDQVTVRQTLSRKAFDGSAYEEHYTLIITRNGRSVDFGIALFRPADARRYPTIIKNCRVLFDHNAASAKTKPTVERDLQAARESVQRGYVLCKFRREDLAPDRKSNRDEGVFPLYPG